MKAQSVGMLFILLSIFFTGCAGVPFAPHYLDPSFSPADVELLTILPVVDIRKDRSVELDEGWEKKLLKQE